MIRNNLPNILREKKMSQKDLAELSGLSENTISKAIKEEALNSETMDKICIAVNMELGKVFYSDMVNSTSEDILIH